MQSIIDAIEQWLKDFLIGAITGNLSNMFSDVNNKVATIATEVGKTPESWNSDVFSIILTLSRNVVVPIAGLVIAAVLTYELISMIVDTEHGITEYDVLSERAETIAADFEAVSTSIKQMEHRMEQIAALKTHIINYAKTRDTYVAYRKTKAADKPAFHTAHEADLLLHEAAKRAFDAQGVKKLPTVKVLQTEYADLLTKKKAAYEDYKRLRKENQELQAVKSNVDTLLRIEEEHQEKKQEQNR